jgi:hypothetical protein
MDLAQEILSEVRESDPFSLEADDFHPGKLSGQWGIEEVSYHLILLVEEGFLARHELHNGILNENGKNGEGDGGLRLTWKGHDLLEELTEEMTYLNGGGLGAG